MKEFGLIGFPLTHSFSKKYFTEKFLREGIDARYELFQIASPESIVDLVASHKDLIGLNVTIPYKERIIPYIDYQSPEVKEIGAVNTIKIIRDSKVTLIGYNTDYYGFIQSIENIVTSKMEGAIILGSGGASKAVSYAMNKIGLHTLVVSRNPRPGMIGYKELYDNFPSGYKIIVNTTPLGTYPAVDTYPILPYNAIDSGFIGIDLVYNPSVTEFMRRMAEQGAVVKNGLGMLYSQADKAWEIWNS